MKIILVIALTLLGTANAASLRRAATEIKATVADTIFVDTLADKYDCRQAGATLAETLENVATKNGQQLASLDKECKERTVNITALWTSAKNTYATEFPEVEKEEVEQFSTAKNAADETFQTLEKNRTDAVENQESDYSGKKILFETAAAAYATAKGAWENEKNLKKKSEKQFNDVTIHDGNKLNANTFEASKQSAAAAMNELITTATKAQTTADELCTEFKNDREKSIIADEELLNNDIGPLIKKLSELKCVDSYYNDAKKGESDMTDGEAVMAGGETAMTESFVEVDADVAAQCAMATQKITALLGLSEQRSSTTVIDTPIMAHLATFTARLSEEKKHMETVFNTCMTTASTTFQKQKNAATDQNKTEVDKAKVLQTAADGKLAAALDLLIQNNNARVATKATEMKASLGTKKAAEKVANTALASVEKAKNAGDLDIRLAKIAQEATVLAAENLKIQNIETRQAFLKEMKQDAKGLFEEEEASLTEFCRSNKADLEKEMVLVNQIYCKLGGLKVTNTAATGLKAEQNEAQAAQAAPVVLVCEQPSSKLPTTTATTTTTTLDSDSDSDECSAILSAELTNEESDLLRQQIKNIVTKLNDDETRLISTYHDALQHNWEKYTSTKKQVFDTYISAASRTVNEARRNVSSLAHTQTQEKKERKRIESEMAKLKSWLSDSTGKFFYVFQ
jgi:hypothetical protein